MNDKRPQYKMTPELEKLLDEVERDRKACRNFAGPFRSREDVQKYLDSLKSDTNFSEPLSVDETIEELKKLND